jgi:MFS family permease
VTLIVIRCLQSAGASSSIAIAYGIIADIAIPAERGSYVGVLMGATNAAPSLGPVIGGILAEYWRNTGGKALVEMDLLVTSDCFRNASGHTYDLPS